MKKIFKLLTSKFFIAAILFLLQIAIIVGLLYMALYAFPRAAFWIEMFFTILSVIVCMYIINRNGNAAYKLMWIFTILLFPIFGGVLYIILGRKTTRRKEVKKMKEINESTTKILEITGEFVGDTELKTINNKISGYITNQSHYPIYKNSGTEYFSSGESIYKSILEELEKAQSYIFMEFFIIEQGEMWNSIFEILKAKVAGGVEVRIIYDDIGCLSRLPNNFYKKLNNIGIKTCVFNKLRASVNANNRSHRKIIVIDGFVSFTGGINIADEYINVTHPLGHWKDTGVKIVGMPSWSFTVMFLRFWQILNKADNDYDKFSSSYYNALNTDSEKYTGFVQPLSGGPDNENPLHKNIFLQIINNANQYVYINTPYLILDDETVLALCLSAKSGVDVRITMPGVPDKWYAFSMSHSFYPILLKAGVKIYEYTPGFNHSKSIISDDRTAYVGSCNFDYRSFYLHYECGLMLYDTDSLVDIKNDYMETLEKCEEISYIKATHVNVFIRLGRSFLRLFAPLF